MIEETSTNVVPRPAIKIFKKSLLKSTSSSGNSSVDKPVILDVKAIEVRSPSPIPEDLVGEEISKQSTSLMTDQEKKVEEKENAQEQQRDRNGEASEKEQKEQKEEDKEKEKIKDENKYQQSENAEGNNINNIGQETSKTNKEIDAEKCADAKERKPEVAPVQTTKLRGKSKATGQVMGGWI